MTEIYCIGPLDKDMIADLIKEISSTPESEKVTLYIASRGGDGMAAIAFYDWIKMKEIPLVTVGIGEVISSALIVFLSATERKATRHTVFRIHSLEKNIKPEGLTPSKLAKESEELNIINNFMLEILKEETSVLEGLKEGHDIDIILDTKEACKKGLVHKIL